MVIFVCGFKPYKETLKLVKASRYTKEMVTRQLRQQKKKPLPATIGKGEFQVILVSKEGVGLALYKFDKTAACRDIESAQHRQLPTPRMSPINLNMSLPQKMGINLGHLILYGTEIEWGIVSDTEISMTVTPSKGPTIRYECDRTTNLVAKLQQHPAFSSVDITTGSGHNTAKFCPFTGGGARYLYIHKKICSCALNCGGGGGRRRRRRRRRRKEMTTPPLKKKKKTPPSPLRRKKNSNVLPMKTKQKVLRVLLQ